MNKPEILEALEWLRGYLNWLYVYDYVSLETVSVTKELTQLHTEIKNHEETPGFFGAKQLQAFYKIREVLKINLPKEYYKAIEYFLKRTGQEILDYYRSTNSGGQNIETIEHN